MFSLKKDFRCLIPVILILALVPLIVFMKQMKLTGVEAFSWIAPVNIDFFSFYKSQLLHVLALLAAVVLIYRFIFQKYKFEKNLYYIPIAIYTLFSILSAIFSKCGSVAINGYVERSEGILTLASYMIILVSVMCLVNSENSAKAIIYAVIFSVSIIGLIGLTQFLGADLFQTDFGKNLILPKQFNQLADRLNFTYGAHQIYSTLYNPNYVGAFAALILPIVTGLLIYLKSYVSKIFAGILLLLSLIILIGSKSIAGLIGFIFGAAVLLILARKRISANRLKAFTLILASIAVIIILSIIAKPQSTDNSIGAATETRINQVKTDNKDLIIETEKAYLKISPINDKLTFIDKNGAVIPSIYSADNLKISLKDAKYDEFYFELNKQNYNTAHIGSCVLNFDMTPDGIRIIGSDGRAKKAQVAQSWGFKGKERFAGQRGYIWSRTIPMLKDTLFIGHGPDTYALYFPQNDFSGKLNAFGNANTMVDKPYSIYLQTGVNTGVVSLIALIALFAAYIISSLRQYIRSDFNSFKDIFGICILAGVIGYCVAGIAIDSVVSVSPTFWALLGLGIAVNRLAKKETAELAAKPSVHSLL